MCQRPSFCGLGGRGAPKTQLRLLLLHSILCFGEDFCFGPRLFPRNDSIFAVKCPTMFQPHIYNFYIFMGFFFLDSIDSL